MKLTVQTLNQQTFDVTIDDNTTLQDLKNEIGKVKEHQPDQMKIIFNGAVLDNNEKKLTEYKVVDGTKVVLLLQKTKVKPVSTVTPTPSPSAVTTSVAPTSIPATDVPATDVPATGEPATGAPATGAPATGAPNMAQTFGAILQQNPQAFMQILMTDPYINQMAQANPQLFAQMLNDPNFMNNLLATGEELMQAGGEDEALYEKVFSGKVDLTNEQKKEVQDIVEMGFPFEEVIQLYVAYGHNKELTVNALFDDQLNDDLK